jgi:two-component system, chemotaxis family, sensor kinase CheA
VNALLEQFLAEASDLLAEVDAGLLHLEREPGDAELINVVFRAAHTIKGSSGLFDFPELTRLTHAGEDLLDAVRSGHLSLDSVMTDDLLAAFDLIRSWLAQVTVTERLPATAAAEAADLITRLRAPTRGLAGEENASDQPEPSRAPTTTSAAPDWLHALGEEWLRDTAEWLVTTSASMRFARYTPDEDCYFRGEDPLNGIRQVPAIDRLGLLQPDSWPPLDEYDEYACRVGFVFATRAAVSELAYLFRYVTDQVDIVELDAGALERLLDSAGDETVPEDGAVAGTADPEDADAQGRDAQDSTDARTLLEGIIGMVAAVGPGADRQTRLASALIVANKAAGLLGQHLLATVDEPADLAVEARRLLALCPAPPAGAGSAKDRRTGPAERRIDGGETVDPATDGGQVGTRTLKVDQEKVDRLMELAGELNVAKNSLTFLADAAEQEFGSRPLSRRIKDQYASMHRIAEELQAAVMDIRMLPFSVSYSRFPRLVRDLSRRLGKTVELVTDGEDTMADKDVIEALGDPLVHLVRNSLDHGIETPADRVLAGKPPQAQVRLTAVSDGDAVVVEVADDGRGIDPDKVRRKAYEKGLISEEQLELIGDSEAIDLVFRPGFSLAAELTDVSGRGVGMDAVRASVERIGGTVTLRSSLGVGTSALLRMPLSMAVTQVVIISVSGQRFGVPVDLVQETVSVPIGELGRALHQQVLMLRGDVLPVLDLAELLDLPTSTSADGVQSVLIVKPGNHTVGLLVDGFDREVDVILKPMAGLLAHAGTFSGTALLGDGLVLLILNLKEMLSRAAHAG